MISPKNKIYTISSDDIINVNKQLLDDTVNIDDKLLKTINILGISKNVLSNILISKDPVQNKKKELIYNLNNLLEHYKIDNLPEQLLDHINYVKLQLLKINNESTITYNTYGLYGLYSFYNNIFDEYDTYESDSESDSDTK